MKKLLIILLISTLYTCTPRHKGTNVDKELYSVYTEFLDDCKKHGIDINSYPKLSNLKLKSMTEETVGICITDENLIYKYRNVYLNNEITDKFLLKFIAYHEMGHCIFELEHDSVSEGYTIMTPNINLLLKDEYEKNWDTMRFEYFQKVRNNQ